MFGGGKVAFELVEELDAAVEGCVDGNVASARRSIFDRDEGNFG